MSPAVSQVPCGTEFGSMQGGTRFPYVRNLVPCLTKLSSMQGGTYLARRLMWEAPPGVVGSAGGASNVKVSFSVIPFVPLNHQDCGWYAKRWLL